MSNSYDKLLCAFQQLWNNRPIVNQGNAYSTIRQIILTDLKDELAHPRTRSTPQTKFYLAIKRIIHSSLSNEEKLQIIELYEKELTDLKM